jgi:hypothetical protein
MPDEIIQNYFCSLNNNFLIYDFLMMNFYEYREFQKKIAKTKMKILFSFTLDLYLFYIKLIINNKFIIQKRGCQVFKNIENIVGGEKKNTIK